MAPHARRSRGAEAYRVRAARRRRWPAGQRAGRRCDRCPARRSACRRASSALEAAVGRPSASRWGSPLRSPRQPVPLTTTFVNVRATSHSACFWRPRMLFPTSGRCDFGTLRVLVGEDDRGDVRRDDRVVDECHAGRQRDRGRRGLAHVDREEHVLVRAREHARADVHVVHRARIARTRVDVDLRGAVGAHAEVVALDDPRPSAEDLDEVVVVVAVRPRERVVEIGIADRDVVGSTAHDVGIAHVVEAHVVDRRARARARARTRARAGSARTPSRRP